MEHGLRQACVLAHLLFNIFFVTVISVAYTHFKVDKDIMNALVHPRKKPEPGGRGEQLAESQPWRRRFGACFARTMQESSRICPRS